MTFYFFWFIQSITSENILKQIEKRTKKSFKKITELEKKMDKHFEQFHKFIKDNEGYKLDLVYSGIFRDMYPTCSLEVSREGFVREIHFEKIHECLKDLIIDKNIKVIFEVEPSMIIPFKDVYLPVKNYRLLTIMYEPVDEKNEGSAELSFLEKIEGYKEIFKKEEYDRMKFDERKRYIKGSIEKILSNYTKKLLDHFKIEDYKKVTAPSEKALNDFNGMIRYAIKNEQLIDVHCDTLRHIVSDQLFSEKPDIYLHLKSNIFKNLIKGINEINKFAISKGNLEFFEKNLGTFYILLHKKAVVAKNSLIFSDVFDTINYFHINYITNTPVPYSGRVEIIILHLSELIRFYQQLKDESEEYYLTIFFENVISAGINTAFWIIKRHIDWYEVDEISNHRYLKEQFKDVVKFLEFYREDPHEYFENLHEYFKIKSSPKGNENVDQEMKIQYELARKKAVLVKKLKRKLQEKIIALSIWMIYKFMRNELPPLTIWDLALPSALSSTEDRHLDNSLTNLFNDYEWQKEAQGNLFDWDTIYPPGGHVVTEFNFHIFWILLNIFKKSGGSKSFVPTIIESNYLKKQLIESFDCVNPDFWHKALNIKRDNFITIKESYKAFVEKLEPSETE
jgi:hypothetical protein